MRALRIRARAVLAAVLAPGAMLACSVNCLNSRAWLESVAQSKAAAGLVVVAPS